jgi:hypothetical protein
MKRLNTFLLFFGLAAANTFAQDEFQPSGSPFAQIFLNYHYDFAGDDSGFEIKRAYLGYKYNFSPEWAADVTLDVGSPEIDPPDSVSTGKFKTSQEMTAYLKTAGLTYKKNNLTLQFGLIGLVQFKIQEKHWGHRYIYNSAQDWTKMGTSADLGVLIDYKISDIFSADFTFRNGEGYKKLQSDDSYRAGLGLTLLPIKGLTLRGFYDYMTNGEDMVTVAHFIGYKYKGMTLGAEYNFQLNADNTAGQELTAISFYGRFDIDKKWEVFARFDQLTSNTLDGETVSWNLDKDQDMIFTGVQYTPIKQIQISLNYQGILPADGDEDMVNAAYLNLNISF